MYTKTIFCRKSGIQATYTDSYWGGNLRAFKEHPFLPELYREIELKRYNLPAEYLAGGILLLLQDNNMLAHTSKYPSLKMAELNQALQKLGSHKLYFIYNEIQTFLANTSHQLRPTLNMLDLAPNPHIIVSAIKALIGEDELEGIPASDSIIKLKQFIAQRKAVKRDKVTLRGRRKNMSLKTMLARTQKITRKAKKENTEQLKEIELKHNMSVKLANSLLDMYLDIKPEIRENLADFYKDVWDKNKSMMDTYDAQSFNRVIELLTSQDLIPAELDEQKLDLDLFADF